MLRCLPAPGTTEKRQHLSGVSAAYENHKEHPVVPQILKSPSTQVAFVTNRMVTPHHLQISHPQLTPNNFTVLKEDGYPHHRLFLFRGSLLNSFKSQNYVWIHKWVSHIQISPLLTIILSLTVGQNQQLSNELNALNWQWKSLRCRFQRSEVQSHLLTKECTRQ